MPKLSGIPPHISDLNLTQFADGEMPVKLVMVTEAHLRTCNKCRTRLEQLRRSAEAYDRYHSQVLKPALEVPQNWPSLQAQLNGPESGRSRLFLPRQMWWTAAALMCSSIVLSWFIFREMPNERMQRVLRRAVVVRTPAHRRLQVTASGHSWYRAATLPGNSFEDRPVADQRERQNTQALFVKANYSWDDPLSARSFAAWRNHLVDKRDRVLLVGEGGELSYRLETEASRGVLRTAALTLRADTLIALRGTFRFEHQDEVSIEGAGEMPSSPSESKTKPGPLISRSPILKQVGPAEELRVFAALDAIGADAGEQITVDIDTSRQKVLVAGSGLSKDREQQIREALGRVTYAAVRFTSEQPTNQQNSLKDGTTSISSDQSAPLRPRLELMAGGSRQFQVIADGALDASSAALAQAHALNVLAQSFPPAVAAEFGPPEREILFSLQRHHADAIEQALAKLTRYLKPLISLPVSATNATQVQGNTSWDIGAAQLYEKAKSLDTSLGRILGGSYSQETGEIILSKLPYEIRELEALAQAQKNMQ